MGGASGAGDAAVDRADQAAAAVAGRGRALDLQRAARRRVDLHDSALGQRGQQCHGRGGAEEVPRYQVPYRALRVGVFDRRRG